MDEAGATPRVAVVGCGRWGRNHVRNYAELGALAGIVDERPEVAAEMAGRHGSRALTFAEALADPAIDALVFALPPSRNLSLGRAAIEAGKHLLVEKPLALSVADGTVLADLAEVRGRVLMVGHILQYHPVFQALLGLVRDGRLGRLLSLVATRLDLGRIRREEDALWALAPHDISMILALVGAAPERVEASGGYQTHGSIADTSQLALSFPDGVRAEIRASWLSPVKEQRLVVVGSDAMAVFDDREPWERKLMLHPWGLREQPSGDPDLTRGDPVPIAVAPGEPLKAECRHFLDCIRVGAVPTSDGREALRVLSVLERASAQMTVGRR